MSQFSSTVSQLSAQKNLFGVGAFVGATDSVGASVGAAVTGDVVAVLGSAQSSGLIWKHASVTLLQVAQVFDVS